MKTSTIHAIIAIALSALSAGAMAQSHLPPALRTYDTRIDALSQRPQVLIQDSAYPDRLPIDAWSGNSVLPAQAPQVRESGGYMPYGTNLRPQVVCGMTARGYACE